MKRIFVIITTFISWVVFFFLTGCIAGKWSATDSSTLDYQKVELIEIGKTTLTEILEWFGPPDNIIDGTQQIADKQWGGMGISIPSTRNLVAPDGMVILIYKDFLATGTIKVGSIGMVTGMQMHNEINENEFFIYLSKEDYTVVTVVSGLSAKEGNTE